MYLCMYDDRLGFVQIKQQITEQPMSQQPLPQSPNPMPLTSSSYPPTKPIPESSIFHKILSQCQPLTPSEQQAMLKNMTLRITNKLSDIMEIWYLQMELFPLKYGQYFYQRIIEGRYKCLLGELEVMIQWEKLRGILKDKYEKEKEKYLDDMHKGFDDNVFSQPSSYFQSQGIKTSYLLNPSQSPFPPQKNPNLKPIIKIKIIAGITVFDLTASNGYLAGVWWKQNLFGTVNSIYINTETWNCQENARVGYQYGERSASFQICAFACCGVQCCCFEVVSGVGVSGVGGFQGFLQH